MKSVDQFIIKLAERIVEKRNRQHEENYVNVLSAKEARSIKMGTAMGLEKGYPEGQERITFELTSAVGGRILNVRRYQEKLDRHDNQTYVIPSGEDVGARVAKIINLELIK